FQGRLTINGKDLPFEVTPCQLASDKDFREAIYSVAGPQAQLPRDMSLLRTAVARLSSGNIKEERRSTSQGWNDNGTSYLVQGGAISRSGFQAAGPGDLVIDLKGEEQATNLDLRPASDDAQLDKLRRHVVA